MTECIVHYTMNSDEWLTYRYTFAGSFTLKFYFFFSWRYHCASLKSVRNINLHDSSITVKLASSEISKFETEHDSDRISVARYLEIFFVGKRRSYKKDDNFRYLEIFEDFRDTQEHFLNH